MIPTPAYEPNGPAATSVIPETAWPPIQRPVLMFHGLKVAALLPGTLIRARNRIDKNLTLATGPDAGHP